jgi:hypothetical protein
MKRGKRTRQVFFFARTSSGPPQLNMGDCTDFDQNVKQKKSQSLAAALTQK